MHGSIIVHFCTKKQYKKPSGGDGNEKILLSCANDIFGKDGIHESCVV